MPRATLSFKLPEEKDEFEMAQKAGAYHACINELYEFLHKKGDTGTEIEQKFWREAFAEFHCILEDRKVDPVSG